MPRCISSCVSCPQHIHSLWSDLIFHLRNATRLERPAMDIDERKKAPGAAYCTSSTWPVHWSASILESSSLPESKKNRWRGKKAGWKILPRFWTVSLLAQKVLVSVTVQFAQFSSPFLSNDNDRPDRHIIQGLFRWVQMVWVNQDMHFLWKCPGASPLPYQVRNTFIHVEAGETWLRRLQPFMSHS